MLRGDKLQETLFNALCQEQVPVSVSLVNGVELEGQIASFDQYSILLEIPALHLVYKHAIFSIVPSRDFKLPSDRSGDIGLQEEDHRRILQGPERTASLAEP